MVEALVKGEAVIAIRQRIPPFLPNRRDQQHIGGGPVEIEKLGDTFLNNRRGKGAKAFPVFDLQIELFLHFRMPGIPRMTAVPQRPRPVFHASLKPADDLPFCQQPGHFLQSRAKSS